MIRSLLATLWLVCLLLAGALASLAAGPPIPTVLVYVPRTLTPDGAHYITAPRVLVARVRQADGTPADITLRSGLLEGDCVRVADVWRDVLVLRWQDYPAHGYSAIGQRGTGTCARVLP